MTNLALNEPKDVRELIRLWLTEVCETGQLPFKNGGGVIVQMLGIWLKSYEMEHLKDIEKRLEALEQTKEAKQ